MAENLGWKDEFDALPAHVQARVRVVVECFGVPLIAAYYRARGLGLLEDAESAAMSTSGNGR